MTVRTETPSVQRFPRRRTHQRIAARRPGSVADRSPRVQPGRRSGRRCPRRVQVPRPPRLQVTVPRLLDRAWPPVVRARHRPGRAHHPGGVAKKCAGLASAPRASRAGGLRFPGRGPLVAIRPPGARWRASGAPSPQLAPNERSELFRASASPPLHACSNPVTSAITTRSVPLDDWLQTPVLESPLRGRNARQAADPACQVSP